MTVNTLNIDTPEQLINACMDPTVTVTAAPKMFHGAVKLLRQQFPDTAIVDPVKTMRTAREMHAKAKALSTASCHAADDFDEVVVKDARRDLTAFIGRTDQSFIEYLILLDMLTPEQEQRRAAIVQAACA